MEDNEKYCILCEHFTWADEDMEHVCVNQEGNPPQPCMDTCPSWVPSTRGYSNV